MNIIFVADVFGLTNEFKGLCQQVTLNVEQTLGVKCPMYLIGPYQQQPKLFPSETAAYQYFMAEVTLAGYVKKLTAKMSTISGNSVLVGFSVGGSAIWQLLSQSSSKQSLAAICFYSSQIRHMTELTPNIPTQLIFPIAEQHFSVAELQLALQGKVTVTLEQSDYLHGFMNALSMNYDPHAYQHYIKKITALLSRQYLTVDSAITHRR